MKLTDKEFIEYSKFSQILMGIGLFLGIGLPAYVVIVFLISVLYGVFYLFIFGTGVGLNFSIVSEFMLPKYINDDIFMLRWYVISFVVGGAGYLLKWICDNEGKRR